MMNLKDVMTETLKIVENKSYKIDSKVVKLESKRFNKKSIVYNSAPQFKISKNVSSTKLYLFNGDTFDAALWSIKELNAVQPLVLDFASDTNPGGGCLSNQQGTQEESLCRRSSLFVSLKNTKYPIPSMGCIYVPDVVVFRDRNMGLISEPYWVSVVAASLRSMSSSSDGKLKGKDEEVVVNKISTILNVALEYNHKCIILGAWGCGAFGNSASEIARAFDKVIKLKYNKTFDHIVFAIPKKSNNCFSEFSKVFISAQTIE